MKRLTLSTYLITCFVMYVLFAPTLESVEVGLGLVVRNPGRIRRAARTLHQEVEEIGDPAAHRAGDEGQAEAAFYPLLVLRVAVHHSDIRHFDGISPLES